MADNNRIQQTKRALLDALEKSLGVVTMACKTVGIDRTTYYRYLKEDKEFAAAVADLSNVALDFAESQLHKQIKSGNTSATIFYLKCKGKGRGYVERKELEVRSEFSDLSDQELIELEQELDDRLSK